MKLPVIAAISLSLLSVQAVAAEQANPAQQSATAANTKPAATATNQTPAQTQAQTQAQPAPATTAAAKPTSATTPAQTAEKTVLPNIPALPTDKAKISYSIGVDLGTNFKAHNIDVDPATLARGLSDTLSGGNALMTKEQVATTLAAFQKQVVAQQKAAFMAASTKNLQEGNTFLTANKTKPGVVTTASGLQYKVITPGKGDKPTDKDTVTVDYAGTFLNGKTFDSSYERGKPVTFGVSDVIHGWTEALKLMQPGATFEIYVPPTLAYGAQGLPGVIGPNQTLVFKIHLIAIKKA